MFLTSANESKLKFATYASTNYSKFIHMQMLLYISWNKKTNFSLTFVTEGASPSGSASASTTHVITLCSISAHAFLLTLRTVPTRWTSCNA